MSEPTDPTRSETKSFYTRPKFIASLIAAIVFLILILQNSQSIIIDVFFWEASAPAALIYVIFAIIGFIVGWLVRRPKQSSKE